jgi:hypothetical protein
MTQISINMAPFTFLLVLSIINVLRFVVEFAFKLTQENPEPLEVTKTETVFLYLSLSYIITYFII